MRKEDFPTGEGMALRKIVGGGDKTATFSTQIHLIDSQTSVAICC